MDGNGRRISALIYDLPASQRQPASHDHTALREASAVKEAEPPMLPPPLMRGLGARKGKKTARMPSAHRQQQQRAREQRDTGGTLISQHAMHAAAAERLLQRHAAQQTSASLSN